MENAIKKAIKLAGSKTNLARIVGITPQGLGAQLRNGKILPDACIAIEKHFPGEITRYELDPAHFGVKPTAPNYVVIVLQNFKSTDTTI
jgi:DNA-binding transcriptional regulator YdaS (Cro superfamily)